MRKAEIGSISHGTMRAEDLIPTFMSVLRSLNPERAGSIQEDVDKLHIVESQDYSDYYDDEDDIEGMTSSDLASCILNEDLFDALDECSPEYCYFGSHPGDGSDYGFWVDNEAVDEAVKYGTLVNINDNKIEGFIKENVDGGMVLYDADMNVIWSV